MTDYPALQKLLTAYFHQDFDLEYDTEAEGIADFAAREDRALVESLDAEMASLQARHLSPQQFDQLLSEIGAQYLPLGAGDVTVDQWLAEVRAGIATRLASGD